MENPVIGVILGLVIAVALIAIIVFVFRWLWNSTMPEVFDLKTLSFGQALKILILASILFGGHRVIEVPQQVSGGIEPEAAQAGQ
jgi:hypothetical protein